LFVGTPLHELLREIYILARHVNISLTESHLLSDFEREVYINMLAEEIERENEQ